MLGWGLDVSMFLLHVYLIERILILEFIVEVITGSITSHRDFLKGRCIQSLKGCAKALWALEWGSAIMESDGNRPIPLKLGSH